VYVLVIVQSILNANICIHYLFIYHITVNVALTTLFRIKRKKVSHQNLEKLYNKPTKIKIFQENKFFLS